MRHWRLVVGLPVGAFVTAIVVSFIVGVGYSSRSRFVPQPRDLGASRISALAAQFSLITGGQRSSESVEFYAELLRSREMLTQAVESRYAVLRSDDGQDSVVGTLAELWNLRGRTSDERTRAAVARLDSHLSISTSREANSVTLAVRAGSAALAVEINQRLLELVGEFNQQKRRSGAAAERAFTEERLRSAQEELEAAEDEQRRFLEQNREYQSAPHLRFEAARLERRVALRQQVYQSLAEAYEQARIEEVRDTPVITVVDHPAFTVAPARSRWLDALVWALAAGLVGLAMSVVIDYHQRERTAGRAEYAEFLALTGRSPILRLLWRLLGGHSAPAGE